MLHGSKSIIRSSVVAVAGCAAALAVLPAAVAAPGGGADAPTAGPPSPYPVLAAGLDNPRQLAFDADGNLYVAEAGHGGDGACIPSDDDPTVDTCFGTSGAITRITADGQQSQVVTGLPSLAPQVATQNGQMPPGAQAGGPSSVRVLDNGDLAFTVGLGSDPANRAKFTDPAGALFGTLDTVTVPATGSATAADVTNVADISAYEAAHNPVPPADAPDSNPTGLLVDGPDYLVTDSGANDLLRADAAGTVSLVTTFDATAKSCPPAPGAPPLDPHPQPVPTSVVKGTDGAFYVSELTGFPFCEGGSTIWRVAADGTATAYATGLTNVTDLAFGPDGTLYAVEIAEHGLTNGPFGAVVAVPPGGGTAFSDYRVVADGLFAPYGIALRGDSAYVTTGSVLPATAGGGQVVRIPIDVSRVKVDAARPAAAGGQQRVAVRVWDGAGDFAAGVPVQLTVSGANSGSGTATTGSHGEIGTFSYDATHAGTDTITATAGGYTATTQVTIRRPVQQPVLSAASRTAGTVNVAVQTHPSVTARKVRLYVVYDPGPGARKVLARAGYGTTDATGRAHAVLTGYVVDGQLQPFRSGHSYVLKARMAGRDYVELLSNRFTVTVSPVRPGPGNGEVTPVNPFA